MPKNKLNVYFPLNNLNPQGWISEFITPVIQRTGNQRSDLANLFYDKEITRENEERINKDAKSSGATGFIDKDGLYELSFKRSLIDESKMSFLNGNFLDMLEVDTSMRESSLTPGELRKYTAFMATIKPYQLAFLHPYIILEYGYRENSKEDFQWVPFPFTQFFDLDFILKNPLARSEGCGITSVNITNTLNLGTHINSKISLGVMFGNMKLLTQEIDANRIPTTKETQKLPFGFSFMKLIKNLNTNKEIIRLTYGKKVAFGFESVAGPDSMDLRSIIERKEKKQRLLNKVGHTFEFDEKGVINLNIDFLNFHDVSILSPNNIAVPVDTPSNIKDLNLGIEFGDALKNYNLLKAKILSIEERLKDAKKTEEATEVNKVRTEQTKDTVKFLTDELSKNNKTFNLLKRSLKPSLTTIFLDKIKAQGQLFGVNFNTTKEEKKFKIRTNIFIVMPDSGDFKNVMSHDDEYDVDVLLGNSKYPDAFKSTNKANIDLLTKIFSRIFNSPYDEKQTDNKKTYGQIMFFPLKALISAGYSFLDDDEKDKIPHMLFGNILMKIGNGIFSINIGDLLIETGVFQKWYYDKFYTKDRLEYSFGAFITDIITDLVPEALYRNRTGFDNSAPTSAITQTHFYLSRDIQPELKEKIYLNHNIEDLRDLSKLLSKIPSKNPKPIIFYGQVTNPTTQISSPTFSSLGSSMFDFKEQDDAEKGIPHIKIGASGGVFTKVDFQAHDFSLIRTAFAMEALADKASRYFIFYYQLKIEMIGNNLLDWDSVVCIPSNPLGIDTEENDPGIAGYYKVKSYSDSLDSNNNYTTTAEAVWVFNPRNNSRETDKAISPHSSNNKIVDFLNTDINNPTTYLIELLEHDVQGIINSELQKLVTPEVKPELATTKDKETKKKADEEKEKEKRLDTIENIDEKIILPEDKGKKK